MSENKTNKSSVLALLFALLPLTTIIINTLNIRLKGQNQMLVAVFNLFCVGIGLALSIINYKDKSRKNSLNTISLLLSTFWLILILGPIIIALIV